MKKLLIGLLLVFSAPSVSGSIVNNSTSSPTSEDSVSFVFLSLDSIGNPTTADSLYLLVSGPGGSLVLKDSMAISDSRITSTTIRGKQFYSFSDQVSNLDGSGAVGSYVICLLAKVNSSGLLTPGTFSFQIISEELSDKIALIGDSVYVKGGAVDSNRTESGSGPDSTSVARWVWNTPQSGHTAAGSFGKYLDTEVSGVGGGPDSMSVARWVWNTPSAWHTNAGSFGKFLDTEVSGAGGGPDSASVARWVWNTPQSSHSTAGTFGKYLDTEVSGLGSGSGTYSVTIIARDSSADQVVPGVSLSVRNLDQSSLIAVGLTDIYGAATFNLDIDTYLVAATAPGYLFDAYDSVEIAGAQTDTLSGYTFDPGAPSSPSLCRVYGHLYGVSGLPQEDVRVAAFLPDGVTRSGTMIVSPFAIETTSDSAGYFYLDLIPSDSLVPIGSSYEFSITRTDGGILRQRLTVPAQSSWRLSW